MHSFNVINKQQTHRRVHILLCLFIGNIKSAQYEKAVLKISRQIGLLNRLVLPLMSTPEDWPFGGLIIFLVSARQLGRYNAFFFYLGRKRKRKKKEKKKEKKKKKKRKKKKEKKKEAI